MFEGMGMLKARLISSFVGPVLITVALMVYLLLVYDLGYWAVVWALIAGYIVEAVMRIVYFLREIDVKLRTFFWHAYGQSLVLVIPLCFLFSWIISKFMITSLLSRMGISSISVLLYIILFGFLFSTKSEKRMLRDIIGIVKTCVLRTCSLVYKRG
jgi:hypothetical protein